MSTTSVPPPNPLEGVAEHVRALLSRLHAESVAQESALTGDDFRPAAFAGAMRDKFIALDEDKAHLVYALCRATGARTVVEAGTSYGVSTIYLALAVAANIATAAASSEETNRPRGRVVATEHEPAKAARAQEHWRECGEAVSSVIDLREGDLLETLKDNLDEVDFLLLDSEFQGPTDR